MGVGIPAEYLLVFAVFRCHDLGRVSCAPLSEQVSYLKILDANSVAHLDPLIKKLEIIGVSVARFLDADKLSCKALAAKHSVKLRSENGSEKHIYAVFESASCVVFNDLPMSVAPNLNVVIICKTVGVEPLGVHKCLLGKSSTDNVDLNPSLCDMLNNIKSSDLVFGNVNREGVFACLEVLGDIYLDPKALKHSVANCKSVAACKRGEKIGEKSGRKSEVIGNVVACIVSVILHNGKMLNVSDANVFCELSAKSGGMEEGCSVPFLVSVGIDKLNGKSLSSERADFFKGLKIVYRLIVKHLFKR